MIYYNKLYHNIKEIIEPYNYAVYYIGNQNIGGDSFKYTYFFEKHVDCYEYFIKLLDTLDYNNTKYINRYKEDLVDIFSVSKDREFTYTCEIVNFKKDIDNFISKLLGFHKKYFGQYEEIEKHLYINYIDHYLILENINRLRLNCYKEYNFEPYGENSMIKSDIVFIIIYDHNTIKFAEKYENPKNSLVKSSK